VGLEAIEATDLVFEFMMNALRLKEGVGADLFTARTGLAANTVLPTIRDLQMRGLLEPRENRWRCSAIGFNFLNRILGDFMTE